MFGLWNYEDAAKVTYVALHSMQHRGQEGAGVVAGNEKILRGYRNVGLLSEIFKSREILDDLEGDRALGDVWYSSVETKNVNNIEPLLFKFMDEHISICMSGNIINNKSLRAELEKGGAVFHSSSSTEIVVHLLRKSTKQSFKERLKEALGKLIGGFSIMILTRKGLYAAVDKNAHRPLVVGKIDDSYCMASETCAFNMIGAEFIDDVAQGELATIDNSGYHKELYTEPGELNIEAMEYIYFASPDSNILGRNVHKMRKRSGKELAKEHPCDADIVFGVPNSSISLAMGYSEQSGIPYEMGLIKNQYIGRTFIQPNQKIRENGVKMKLSAIKDVVNGKRIVLLDDSIVRGTTSKRIVALLRSNGAKEIHLRIGAPAIMFPSYTGIDMSSSGELISANLTKEEACKEIGADSLEFMSLESLDRAVKIKTPDGKSIVNKDIFIGKYVNGLQDYKYTFESELTKLQKEVLKGALDE